MHGVVRWGLYTAAVFVLLAVAAAVYAAYLLNGEGVRLRVEAMLTHTLGRRVTMAHLRLSPRTGSAIADDFRIADDPAFSAEPFVTAGSIRIGLDVSMLLLQRRIRIRSLALQQPAIHLLRDAAGEWNYASLAPAHSSPRQQSSGRANVDILGIVVEQGSVLVRTVTPNGSEVRRSFVIRSLQVRDLGNGKVSAFHVVAQLPADGSVVASGTADPWNEDGASHMPVQAHLEVNHLQLLSAGLVRADSPVSGDVEHAAVDLHLDASGLKVAQLRVDSSRLVVRPNRSGTATVGAGQSSSTNVWKHLLQRLVVEQAQVHIGALEINQASGRESHLRAVQASLRNWSPGGRAGFTVFTQVAGGTLFAKGGFRVPVSDEAQPLNAEAEVSTSHLRLASSGLFPQSAPIDALADSSTHVRVAEHAVQADGSFRLVALRMARNGQPSALPVTGSFQLHQALREHGNEATLEQSTVQLGKATLHIKGSYTPGVRGPSLKLAVTGDRMPVDALESFLPSAGVVLPEGSRLQGGTLSLSLEVKGSPAHPEVNGPVQLEAARLAGFDLGSKLRSLANFTGGRLGSATVSGTEFRSLNFTIHTGLGTVVTDHLSAEVAGIGTATGAGSIGTGGALDYRLALKLDQLVPGNGGPSRLASELAGALPPAWARRLQGAIKYLSQGPMKNGIPLLIRGTARKPSITPDLGALLPAQRHP